MVVKPLCNSFIHQVYWFTVRVNKFFAEKWHLNFIIYFCGPITTNGKKATDWHWKRAQVEILSKEGYSERGIAKKLGLSKNGMHHCLQRLRETGLNIDRKRSGRPRVTSISEDKHLIISSKRNRRKTAPELTTEMNSNRQHPVSLTTVKRRLLCAGLRGCVAVKKPPLNKANKLKRLH